VNAIVAVLGESSFSGADIVKRMGIASPGAIEAGAKSTFVHPQFALWDSTSMRCDDVFTSQAVAWTVSPGWTRPKSMDAGTIANPDVASGAAIGAPRTSDATRGRRGGFMGGDS
jgi:hypothetical protein